MSTLGEFSTSEGYQDLCRGISNYTEGVQSIGKIP